MLDVNLLLGLIVIVILRAYGFHAIEVALARIMLMRGSINPALL